ncbi:hypothetical protein [Leptolyngbya sp. BC1307]|uniref:hypothetical protein n=1 Tax=Leptolyngbya sp. BC1307 TaxID=2029589 RepID=UPI001140AF59|nr:hypothetical protein [Leptolyngbya sp. BC1307]
MIKLFTHMASAVAQRLTRLWAGLQLQRFVAIAFVGLFLLTTSVDNSNLSASTKDMLNDMIARGESGRPVTTGQWQGENEQLQGKPGKQAKRIVKESADAVGEMGEIYPGNAKTVLPGLENRSLESDD